MQGSMVPGRFDGRLVRHNMLGKWQGYKTARIAAAITPTVKSIPPASAILRLSARCLFAVLRCAALNFISSPLPDMWKRDMDRVGPSQGLRPVPTTSPRSTLDDRDRTSHSREA
jgi:hypothetical protein